MDPQLIQDKIYEMRSQRVMLDYDLAACYEMETKRLKGAVRRNRNRFPADFMFELSEDEFEGLRSQIVTSTRGGTRYRPFAFTEQGVAMLASVLNSPKAIAINLQLVRAFVLIRRYGLSQSGLSERIKALEGKHDQRFEDVYSVLDSLHSTKTDEQPNRNSAGV